MTPSLAPDSQTLYDDVKSLLVQNKCFDEESSKHTSEVELVNELKKLVLPTSGEQVTTSYLSGSHCSITTAPSSRSVYVESSDEKGAMSFSLQDVTQMRWTISFLSKEKKQILAAQKEMENSNPFPNELITARITLDNIANDIYKEALWRAAKSAAAIGEIKDANNLLLVYYKAFYDSEKASHALFQIVENALSLYKGLGTDKTTSLDEAYKYLFILETRFSETDFYQNTVLPRILFVTNELASYELASSYFWCEKNSLRRDFDKSNEYKPYAQCKTRLEDLIKKYPHTSAAIESLFWYVKINQDVLFIAEKMLATLEQNNRFENVKDFLLKSNYTLDENVSHHSDKYSSLADLQKGLQELIADSKKSHDQALFIFEDGLKSDNTPERKKLIQCYLNKSTQYIKREKLKTTCPTILDYFTSVQL